jgi:hypothetical protein
VLAWIWGGMFVVNMALAVSNDPTELCAMPGLAAYDYFMEQCAELEEQPDAPFNGSAPARGELHFHSLDLPHAPRDDRRAGRRSCMA